MYSKKWMVFVLFCLAFLQQTIAQNLPQNESEFEANYQKRIVKDRLYGVYIPKDLNDAFSELTKLTNEESRQKFKNQPSEGIEEKFFYGLGRWMIKNWGFYGGSRYSHYIKSMGIFHPEDMAKFTIIAYHQFLNGKEVDIPALMKIFHKKQNEEKQKLIEEGEVIYQEQRQREQPIRKDTIRQ